MVLSVVIGGKHVSLNEVLLVTTSTASREYAQIVLDAGVLEGIEKATASAKKAQNIPSFSSSGESKQEILSQFHVRAALFARVVHAMQGRSGLRPCFIQFLVDILNENVQSLEIPADDIKCGEYFIELLNNGSNLSSNLIKELKDKKN
jgi:hypothetical protein